MPDSRSHRGLAPDDDRLFARDLWEVLRQATADLSWLLARGYAARSATDLVGNRYSLNARQRIAVARSACSDQAAADRARRRVAPDLLCGEELWIDGFNILTGLEVALSGGIVLIGRDGCCRDIAGIYRHYRNVEETMPALRLLGDLLERLRVSQCCWWLDKPVSNSGRLRQIILEVAAAGRWRWTAELAFSPDAVLSKTDRIVVSSDSIILDRCRRWFNLARLALESIPGARTVDLS